MNNSPTQTLTALDELLHRSPPLDPQLLAQARQGAELLRKLGLLSTEPTETIRPLTRQRRKRAESAAVNSWISHADIVFTKQVLEAV